MNSKTRSCGELLRRNALTNSIPYLDGLKKWVGRPTSQKGRRKLVGDGYVCGSTILAKKAPKLPIAPLADLLAWWRKNAVPAVIIGGLAVAFRGRPRVTHDVDAVVMIPEDAWEAFLKSGAEFGFHPRIHDALAFARETRVLLLHHQKSRVDVDISLGLMPFEEGMLARAKPVMVKGLAVPVATSEDLIIMKAIAHRDRDLVDIAGVVDMQRDLDLAHIRGWISKFAEILEMPELVADLERLLPKKPTRGKGKRKS